MFRFKALIFDVDGTLADTEQDGHRPAFNAAFAEAGLDWVWDRARYRQLLAVTGGKERIQHFLTTAGIRLDPALDIDAFVAALHQAKNQHYRDLLQIGAIPLRTGVRRLLHEARATGIRLAIATTSTHDNVAALLAQPNEPDLPNLNDWFEVIAAGDSVPHKKPAPDIYFLALAKLRLAAHDCVVIEDSAQGAQAALAADLKALLITVNAETVGQNFGAAPAVVDGLGEPNQPLRVLSGDVGGRNVVDLAALDWLHRRAYANGSRLAVQNRQS